MRRDLTTQRFDHLVILLMGLMLGLMIGLVYCSLYTPEVPVADGWYIQDGLPYVTIGKSLKPDVEMPAPVDPDKLICNCLSFVDENDEEIGVLCRCDVPGKPILFFFEGSAEGLAQLYMYLDEGVKEYYDELQKKRWPRMEEQDPDFSEEPFERGL